MPIDPYKPIACADYDIYEIAIMQKRQLLLSWKAEQGDTHQQVVRPLELKIIDGAEYLVFESLRLNPEKTVEKLRLDIIKSASYSD